METGANEPGHLRPHEQIDELRRFRLLKETCKQAPHGLRAIGVPREGDLRAHGKTRLDVITMMDPGQYAGDLFAGNAQNREWLATAQQWLQKIVGSGIMGREIRLGQAGAPTGLYYTIRHMVEDMIHRSGLVQHYGSGAFINAPNQRAGSEAKWQRWLFLLLFAANYQPLRSGLRTKS
jgi:hypothetical protein